MFLIGLHMKSRPLQLGKFSTLPVTVTAKEMTDREAPRALYKATLGVAHVLKDEDKQPSRQVVCLLRTIQQETGPTFINTSVLDFPGGAMVGNPPANAGDMGSSPGPGRSHMPWSN